MTLDITNPRIIEKVGRLVQRTGLSEAAAIEQAVDRLLSEHAKTSSDSVHIAALLAELDQIQDRTPAAERIEWDARGLPC